MEKRSNKLMQGLSALLLVGAVSTGVQAGSIYLTGHDVLLHDGQNGYDSTILDYLRDAGVAGSEIAAADYDIGLLRGFQGNVGSVGVNVLEGYGSIVQHDIATFTDGADFAAYLSAIDVLVIPSHSSCGGCDLSSADADILEGFAPQIADFLNAGGDIYANAGAADSTFYNFLPPSALATGASIGGSTGFTPTADGTAIGITLDQINGFPTHNRFTGFSGVFTVFETRGSEVISIGVRNASVNGGGLTTGGTVPVPATWALFVLGLVGFAARRRDRGA